MKFVAVAAIVPLMAACSGTGSAGGDDAAASYPKDCKTINIQLGFSAGGATDLAFRILADSLAKNLDTDVQVVNSPGGGGVTAINEMLKSKPDGCTLGHSSIPSHLQYLFPESPAKYTKDDFAFAGAFGIGPQVLVVPADSPVKTLDDLVALGKKNGKLTAVADAPKGGDAIINAQFAQKSGINVKQVIVDGSAEKVTALLSKQVDFANGAIGGILSAVQSGQLRALAVWSNDRAKALPDVPTAKELGIDVVVETRFALAMPKAVPEPVRQKLEDSMKAITAEDSFVAGQDKLGIQTAFETGAEYSKTWDEMATTVKALDLDSLS